MRIASVACIILASALAVFGCWGLGTQGGRHTFDEMAGMIPFAALLLGAALAACAAVLSWRVGRAAKLRGLPGNGSRQDA